MKSKIKIFSCFGNTQQIEWHCFLCLIIMKNKKNQDKQLVKTNESVKEEKMSKKKEEFPGYPHYPQDEDVLSSRSHAEKIEVDVEKMSASETGRKGDLEKFPAVPETSPDFTPDIVSGTDADVTAGDLKNLGEKDGHMDDGEDQTLLKFQEGPDQTGDDLDVPGSELDDAGEEIGSEDEENNYYSKGQE